MGQIHNTKLRIPIILDVADAKKWISQDLKWPDIENLMKPFGASGIESYAVSHLLPPGLGFQCVWSHT